MEEAEQIRSHRPLPKEAVIISVFEIVHWMDSQGEHIEYHTQGDLNFRDVLANLEVVKMKIMRRLTQKGDS